MKHQGTGFFIIAVFSFWLSCSGKMDKLIPDSLGVKEEARLEKRFSSDEASALFHGDRRLVPLLYEFKPLGINAGSYDVRGIKVNLGLARCASADDAFGIYSGLTAGPRERWKTPHGEMSNKSPYVAGYAGEYVFWFFSPSNPKSYFDFYYRHGQKILGEFDKLRRASNLSYHSKILPVENRYADSMFYVKSRMIHDIKVTNAYAAAYQMKMKVANIYVMKFDSDRDAERRLDEYKAVLGNARKKTADFIPMPGAPARAFHWEEPSGTQLLCQYRWLILYCADMSDFDYAKEFIAIMFHNMQKIRTEVMPTGKP